MRALPVRNTLPLLAASLCFGTMAVAVRAAGRELPVLQVACIRFTGSFLLLLATAAPRERLPRTASVGALVLRGLVGTIAIVLYFLGIRGAGAALATLLQNTYPVFTALLAVTVEGERLSRRLLGALALNLVGVTAIVVPGLQLGAAFTRGAICSLLAAMLSSVAVTAAARLRRTESATLITLYFMATGAVVTAPAMLTGVTMPSPGVLVALVVMIVTSASGQWLLHFGLGYTSATAGSVAVRRCRRWGSRRRRGCWPGCRGRSSPGPAGRPSC